MSNSGNWQTYLSGVISGDKTGAGVFLIRMMLGGLEFVYRILSGLKFLLSRKNRRRLPVPVISVGNITAGGTGKTPAVIWLVKLLKDTGLNPAILTRGYSGKYQKTGLVFTGSALNGLTAADVGDEPFLLAKLLPDTFIAVGRERYRSGLKALAANQAIDLFILDDGFQHWSLERDLDIVIIDAMRPFSNRHLIPRGLLREPLSSLKRAGVIFLTRTAKVAPDDLKNLIDELAAINSRAAIGAVSEENSRLIPLFSLLKVRNKGVIPAAEFLKGRKVAAITGIGNPRQFLASLENMGAEVGYFKAYPDHYRWEAAELAELMNGLAENGFSELIITAKDGVKMEPWAKLFDKYGLACYVLSLDFTMPDQYVIERIKAAIIS